VCDDGAESDGGATEEGANPVATSTGKAIADLMLEVAQSLPQPQP